MKKLLSSNKGILLFYGIIMVGITSLCLLFLIGGIYEISAVLAISSVSSFVVLVIMLYGQLERTEDGYKAGKFIAFRILFHFGNKLKDHLVYCLIILSLLIVIVTHSVNYMD